MDKKPHITRQLTELLYQALETERGAMKIYEAALSCAQNEDLEGEWKEYLEQTRAHERVLLNVFEKLGLNPDTVTPGREVAAHIADSLVIAMEQAIRRGSAETAQLVAGECVILANNSDHQNWKLIEHLADNGQGEEVGALRIAIEMFEQDEDHALYHTEGFSREWGCRFSVRNSQRVSTPTY